MDRDIRPQARPEPRTTSRDDFYEAVPAAPVAPAYSRAVPAGEPVAAPVVAGRDRVGRVIEAVLAVVEFFLLVRLLFRALNANTASPIVRFVYNVTLPLIKPFVGIFTLPTHNGIEIATITAMIVYGVLGWILIALIRAISGRV